MLEARPPHYHVAVFPREWRDRGAEILDRGEPTHCRDTFGRLPRPYTVGGEKAFQFANAGVFTERTVVRASQAVVIDQRVPFEEGQLMARRIPNAHFVPLDGRNHVLLDSPLSGDAGVDARRVVEALARGRNYVAIDALAPADGFYFRASRAIVEERVRKVMVELG